MKHIFFAFSALCISVAALGDSVIQLSNEALKVSIDRQTGQLLSLTSKGQPFVKAGSLTFYNFKNGQTWPEGKYSAELTAETTESAVVTLKSSDGLSGHVQYELLADSLQIQIEFTADLPAMNEGGIGLSLTLPAGLYKHVFFPQHGGPEAIGKIRKTDMYYKKQFFMPMMTLYADRNSNRALTVHCPFDRLLGCLMFGLNELHDQHKVRALVHHGRIGQGARTKAVFILTPHTGDWRPGLAMVQKRYPEFFTSNDAVRRADGKYAMSGYTDVSNPEEKKKLIEQVHDVKQRDVTWQQMHVNFPFYGVYVPDRKTWPIIIDRNDILYSDYREQKVPRVPSIHRNSVENMRNTIEVWRKAGLQSYVYFNAFDCWEQFAREQFPDDRAHGRDGKVYSFWKYCNTMNPKVGTAWRKHIEDQAVRLIELFPESNGIFWDMASYANRIDYSADDGSSMVSDQKACYLGHSMDSLLEKITRLAHERGKGIWVNGPTCTEAAKHVDGVMCEGSSPWWAGTLAYWGLNRPMLMLMYDASPAAQERKMKMCLAMGYQPAAGTPEIDARWDPMFRVLRNKKWVLSPWALDLPEGMDGNIFENARGQFLVSLVSPHASRHDENSKPSHDVSCTVRLPAGKAIRRAISLSPGENGEQKLHWKQDRQTIHLNVPTHHIATLIVLEPQESNDCSAKESPTHE